MGDNNGELEEGGFCFVGTGFFFVLSVFATYIKKLRKKDIYE